jgi:membrane protein
MRQRFEGSAVQELGRQLKTLDFGNQAMLLGAGLLASLLPLLVLTSAFASEHVDDDLALRLGLDRRPSDIVAHLFSSAPAPLNVGTITSLLFIGAGTLAVASSLQQIYEKVFHQDPRGIANLPRQLVWIAVLCCAVAFESVVVRPARHLSGGRVLAELDTFRIFAPFFWWTMHFLLAARVRWQTLLPSAVATGAFYVGLGIFSEFYFSSPSSPTVEPTEASGLSWGS